MTDFPECRTRVKTEAVGVALTVLLVAVLAFRITRGVDLSDESYYALLVDDWLKGGIASSTFRTIHQTAALLVYPAAWLHARLTGASDGLLLFLRGLFLVGAVVSSLFWTVFLRRLGYQSWAWAAGLFVLAFVPFGLPAPSYNTMGQQALSIALACFGCAALFERPQREQFWWLAMSGGAWAVATIAYPSMIVPLAILCLIVLRYRDDLLPRQWLYPALAAAAVGAGWCLVALAMTPARLYDCFMFSGGGFDADGKARRWILARDFLALSPYFPGLCAAAIGIGLLRPKFPLVSVIATIVLIAVLFTMPPALFARSHDAVTLIALTGLGLLAGLQAGASRGDRIIGTIYAVSMVAGLTSCATAHATIYNFCIGALPAAVLAVMHRPSTKLINLAGVACGATAIAALLSTSVFFYYGEIPGQVDSPRERMASGPFAGLALIPNDAALIHLVQDRIAPQFDADRSMALFGRFPGLALTMSARLKMRSPYAILPVSGATRLESTQEFYRDIGRQPQLVLIYRDIYLEPVNPIPHFDDRYGLVSEWKTPLGTLTAFRPR